MGYDSIIIGAGYNGLVCAACLARGGQRVLVLEGAAAPGGLAAAREFHDGFRVPVAHASLERGLNAIRVTCPEPRYLTLVVEFEQSGAGEAPGGRAP